MKRPIRWARPALIAMGTALVLLGAPTLRAAGAEVLYLDAAFTGSFKLTSGGPGTFQIKESGTGQDQALGAFTYKLTVRYSSTVKPPQCPTQGSSTGQSGAATLVFSDGRLAMELVSGASCFTFPHVNVTEDWEIVGGSGRYANAEGVSSRSLQGDVRTGAATGTWLATITVD